MHQATAIIFRETYSCSHRILPTISPQSLYRTLYSEQTESDINFKGLTILCSIFYLPHHVGTEFQTVTFVLCISNISTSRIFSSSEEIWHFDFSWSVESRGGIGLASGVLGGLIFGVQRLLGNYNRRLAFVPIMASSVLKPLFIGVQRPNTEA